MFDVSEYMIRQVRALVTEKGILALPEPRKGKKLSEETIKKMIDFYLDDDNSRIMPKMKVKMFINRKRLVLSNLSELHSFKTIFSQTR